MVLERSTRSGDGKMTMELLLIVAALFVAFSNGANDNFKGFATVDRLNFRFPNRPVQRRHRHFICTLNVRSRVIGRQSIAFSVFARES
jgi:hypothetical protein